MIRRRAAVVIVALALMACDATPSGELSPSRATAPTPPDGMIVGIAVVARTPSHQSIGPQSSDLYLKFDQGGATRELTLAQQPVAFTLPLDTYDAIEDGLKMSYRPFAIKLKAGRGAFRSFESRDHETELRKETRLVSHLYKDSSGNWQTRWGSKTETVVHSSARVRAAGVPATTFDLEPGKVLYLGRFGVLLHANTRFVEYREPFLGSEPVTDLAMIRRHFPKLAGVEIEVRPIQTAPGNWKTLTGAAREYAITQ